MEATRQLFWNSDGRSFMYFIALISFVIFILGFSMKVRSWQRGRHIRYDNLGGRFITLFTTIVKHDRRVFKGSFRRFMHLSVFYGFVILTIGTMVIAIQDNFGVQLFLGGKYLILSFLMDLFGSMAVIGIGMAAYKRYIDKPDHEEYTFDDAFLLILVFVILFTGFVLEGLRIYSTNDPWAGWSPGGLLFSAVIQLSGLTVLSALTAHAFLWYFHMLLALGFMAYIPYSKLFHIFSASLNIFLKSASPIGELSPVEILSEASNIGATQLGNFTRKQLLELDACISCGRCQKGCPAYLGGAPLSPRVVLQGLKRHSLEKYSIFPQKENPKPTLIIGQVISRETLLACTTCGLCEDKCPIHIEHIKRIVDMRRSLPTDGTGYPAEVQKVFTNLREVGNPWGSGLDAKFHLAEESKVPLLNEKKQTDVLYWVGCFGSYESRNKKVSQVMFKLLEKAGINYATIGREEQCCGDFVRRLGNEKIFQQLAQENIKNLDLYQFKTIVTHCPHCYNALKNEYPQFGGHYHVMHHSEYILELIKSGKIIPKGAASIKVTFHDPCYIGRYNSIYNAPREVLSSIPGLELVEMKNNRSRAFCCGAGGGRIWMDDSKDHPINNLLIKRAQRTEAAILVSACSLCLTTLTEAVRNIDCEMASLDIAEIVYNAL